MTRGKLPLRARLAAATTVLVMVACATAPGGRNPTGTQATPTPPGDATTDAATDSTSPSGTPAPAGAVVYENTEVSTFAGSSVQGRGEGFREEAQFNKPGGLAFNGRGTLWVWDLGNVQMRFIDENGWVRSAHATASKVVGPVAAPDGTVYAVVNDAKLAIVNESDVWPVVSCGMITFDTLLDKFTTQAGFDWVDFVPGPMPVATPTPTASPTPEPTPTPTPTPEPSPDPSAPPTPTPDPSASPTPTPTPTRAPTAPPAPTPTPCPPVDQEGADSTGRPFYTLRTWKLDSRSPKDGHRVAGPQIGPSDCSFDKAHCQVGSNYTGYVDGSAQQVMFREPKAIALMASGSIYVADSGNHAIRLVTKDGTVTTHAGDGSAGFRDGKGKEAKFSKPSALVIAPNDDLFVLDLGNAAIRRVKPDGTVTTVAGGGAGFKDGPGREAKFSAPTAIALSASGSLFVSDGGNNRIRKIEFK